MSIWGEAIVAVLAVIGLFALFTLGLLALLVYMTPDPDPDEVCWECGRPWNDQEAP